MRLAVLLLLITAAAAACDPHHLCNPQNFPRRNAAIVAAAERHRAELDAIVTRMRSRGAAKADDLVAEMEASLRRINSDIIWFRSQPRDGDCGEEVFFFHWALFIAAVVMFALQNLADA